MYNDFFLMSEIAKAYEPAQVEQTWYQRWLESGCFHGVAAPGEKDPFSIVIPPPNVTGVLHMGHLLNNTIQDMLIRRARQQGKAAVWVPGTDHAGIATQTRVERKLREQGKTRHDLGREKFVEVAGQWRDEHRNIILDQLKKLGASCDWERTVHTLDEDYSRGVLQSFVDLFHKGKIYRGARMVNWCPVSLTALSDEEVIMKPQKGFLFKMRYEIVERPGEYVEISTTRPETIMGDTAVAVHPEDKRYQHLRGMHVYRPFPKEPIPFVFDESVDREFGTGVLKVTPAHDRVDWEIGQRHNLPILDVLTPEGKINCPAVPELHGRERFEARKVAGKMLETLGLLVERETYENNVGFSERADVPIEPRLSDQWWLRYPKVEEAKRAVENGTIKFYPERWTKTYLHWLGNIQDWCISRQLWWGHRIPVWYKKGLNRDGLTEADLRDPAKVHVSIDGPADPENWEQENDVLDTWASSWLWPFGVFGWPQGTPEQQKELNFWYPTSVLATGFDIIFFWVARMVMAGLEFMGEPVEDGTMSDAQIAERIPFRAVYFNGLIRDEKGRKMSKSLGNSPDPLDLIAKFGADGLRMGVLLIAPKGQDILFSEERVQQGRNFANKLWNAARFRQMSDEGSAAPDRSLSGIFARIEPAKFDADDHAILSRLAEVLDAYGPNFEQFEVNAVTGDLYSLMWNDFCDWYLEVSKAKLQNPELKANCLAIQDLVLREILLMLHPIMPFITEQLAHDMGFIGKDEFIQNVSPSTGVFVREQLSSRGGTLDASAAAEIDALRDFASKVRALKAQYNLANKRDVTLYSVAAPKAAAILASHGEKLKKLVGAAVIEARTEVTEAIPAVVTELGTVYLDLSSAIDPEAERARLSKEIAVLQKAIAGAEAKLGNASFTDKAPPAVVDGVRATLATNKAKLDELSRLLAGN